ncbi:NPCBM/NEW2 domain-containing protein [Kibdelosporangium aridum]|uniref:Alpha-galactosidase n=1 Tax=Kibdelosporangium aridum TaxID=2030 RepID=A0A1W2FE56_KIBAR|nr:NPCBM/NEW2 domain-containing protein [Kibdelosporangium aridum]SMD20325.1 alpha-galactosidase [Kibdelosporangium aridum]
MRRRLVAALAALSTTASFVITAVAATTVITAAPAQALENGLARTPPMGFNNWNTTHCRAEFNEKMVMDMADIFVSRGLKDVGYQYVNIDDCWAKPQRNAQGNLEPDPVRFPRGIKFVADYVHSKGLKFGIYTSAGTKTCNTAGFPGGLNNEQRDANLFASWGVDYLKYDNCNNQGVDAKQRYTKMRDALAATGRPIVYSICEWGQNKPWEWAQNVGNLWRTTGDINDTYSKMVDIFKRNLPLAQYAKPGAWNDPDMLEVGNGGMTPTEYRSHFSLWAIMAAPLLIGSDLRKVSQENFTTLLNKDVIDVDQDRLGIQGKQISVSGNNYVIAKPLSNGDYAVALFNNNSSTQTISTTASAIGIGQSSSYNLKDLWSKSTRSTTGAISASVPAHGTVMYRVSKGVRTPPAAGTHQVSDLSWDTASNGWGPVEKDRSNGERPAGDGKTLTINGTTYTKGLGVHAASEVSVYLGRACSTFSASVGIDDEVAGSNGTVVFQVFADGTTIADSGTMTGAMAAKQLSGSLANAEQLRLVVTNGGDTINYDHADWANPTITCG